jgi:hypothetical protein
MVMNSEKDVDLETIYNYISQNKIKAYEGWMRNYSVEIILNLGDQHLPEAEDLIKKAIDSDKQNGMMFHLAKDYVLYAELLKRKNNTPDAKEKLNRAIGILKGCGAEGWVKKYENELTKL